MFWLCNHYPDKFCTRLEQSFKVTLTTFLYPLHCAIISWCYCQKTPNDCLTCRLKSEWKWEPFVSYSNCKRILQKIDTCLNYFVLEEEAHNHFMYNYSLFCTITGSSHVLQRRRESKPKVSTHSRNKHWRIYSIYCQYYLIRTGVSGEDQHLLPLIGEAEIISIPQSIKFSGRGPICLWLQSLAGKSPLPFFYLNAEWALLWSENFLKPCFGL